MKEEQSDCQNCHKDFCDCVRESFKAYRKADRNRKVTGTLNVLAKYRIAYTESATENMVQIPIGEKQIYLSLKSIRDEKGYTVYKFRIKGDGTWHTARKDAFLKRVKQLQ